MIGKYIWSGTICEMGVEKVYVRCDVCGHERSFLHSYLQRIGKNKGIKFLPCDRCRKFISLEKRLCVVNYASNEIFLK